MKRVLLLLLLSTPAMAGTFDDDATRLARWVEIRSTIFAAKPVAPTATLVTLDAPVRALDAALVPLTVMIPERVAGMSLVIDDNPSPYAAHFTFGPAAVPGPIALRVRVNSYTNIHAVVETSDGKLFETTKFVKAAGGCSAPIGLSEDEALKGMGEMRLRLAPGTAGQPETATLMIRHPNFSGMQMDQITRLYTPARYIQTVEVSVGGARVFKLDGDISLSTNPVITFPIMTRGAALKVVATDNSGGRWEQSFPPPKSGPASAAPAASTG